MYFLTTLLTLLLTALAAPTAETLTKRAPIITARAGDVIPGKYIIKLKEGANNNVLNAAVSKLGNFKADHVYRGRRFKGFAGKIEAALLEELRALPHVSIDVTDSRRGHLLLIVIIRLSILRKMLSLVSISMLSRLMPPGASAVSRIRLKDLLPTSMTTPPVPVPVPT